MRLEGVAAVDAGGGRIERTPSAARVRRSVSRILRANVLCAIATVAPGGRAHVNTAYFASSADLELYFLSHPGSRHCRNLAANRSMAIAVFSSEQTWGGSDRGLQLFGTCAMATGSLGREAERLYGKRFRDYESWKAGLGQNDPARQYRLYRFVVRSLKAFDERQLGGALFVRASVVRSSRAKGAR